MPDLILSLMQLILWFVVIYILAEVAWHVWMHYVNVKFLAGLKWIILEIKLPKETRKSPLAMEIILNSALNQTGGYGTWYDKYWKGSLPHTFSLEIVSIGGKVHFLIRTQARFKNVIEADIYAQFTDAEINEVPDYTNFVHYSPDGKWDLWGCEYKFTKPDPYPIATYVDFGLDKDPKEEYKIDPLTSIIEFFGSLKEGEQAWTQMIIRSTRSDFKKAAAEARKKIIADYIAELAKRGVEKPEVSDQALPKSVKDIIFAIDRNASKLNYDVGIRSIYIAEKDKYNGANIGGLINLFKQFNTEHLNGIRHTRTTSFDFPWQDWNNTRVNGFKKNIFYFYKLRSYYYPPYKPGMIGSSPLSNWITENKRIPPMVMSSEELATIYHFPGSTASTPTFDRIEAKKSEPPANLPI